MENDARLSRKAWVQSMDASDTARAEDYRDDGDPLEVQHIPRKWHQKGPPATTTTTTTTPVTNAQLKALIDQGVIDALAACDTNRSRNSEDNHDSGTGVKRQEPPARDNCTMENQIKFSTCTLLGSALTWWNSHVKTVGLDVAYAMTWINLKNKMIDKYCPRGEIKKLEELALMCARMFPEESYKIERYIDGLPYIIHESVIVSKPKTMQDVIEFTTELVDKKIITVAERRAENKRRSTTNANTANNQRGTKAGQKPTCFECGAQGHFKRECPKLKNNNHNNQCRDGNAPTKVYVVGHAGTNRDSNVVTGTFLLNNRYASILVDAGVDRIFMSTAFSS
nr:hypothetical protein [Tanacetum cinerariifolium]